MKTIIPIILLIIFNLFLFTNSKAENEAEFVKLVKEYTYKPDGSVEYHYNKILKLNTHISFNNLYGETFVIYNPEFQKLDIHECYTRQAGGQIIKAPQNAFNEVLPSFAAGAPAYNHLKEMVITHTGLEPGSTVYLDYVLSGKPLVSSLLEIDETLQELTPVKEYELIVNIPDGQELYYTLINSAAKPEISVQQGVKSYKWRLKNVPPLSRESGQPVNQDNNIRFVACGTASCKDVLTLFQNRLSNDPDSLSQKIARQITAPAGNEREKIFFLRDYTAGQIHTIGVSLENAAYRMRSPEEVLNTLYGTEAEKTLLLATLLKAEGFTPEITVIYPGYLKNKAKGFKSVRKYLVKVNADRQTFFLSAVSPAAESLELRGGKDDIWLISASDIRPLTVMATQGAIRQQATVRLNSTLALSEGIIDMEGGIVPANTQKALENEIKAFGACFGTLSDVRIEASTPIDYRLQYTAEQTLTPQGKYLLYPLPESTGGANSWGLYPLVSVRKTALELPYPLTESYDYVIETEPALNFKGKNVSVKRQNKIGSVDIRIEQNDRLIKVHKTLQLNKSLISPSEYGDFRKLMNDWADPQGKTLIFEQK